jgi:ABC-type Zn uptake system ZnuABC Zn-binding protein ZnuA
MGAQYDLLSSFRLSALIRQIKADSHHVIFFGSVVDQSVYHAIYRSADSRCPPPQ